MSEKENELVEPTDPPDNQNTSGNAATPDLNLDPDSVEGERSTTDPPDNQRNSGG
jgi:hypothetical protein